MRVWRIGPLRVATSLPCPTDWASEEGGTRADVRVTLVGARTPPKDAALIAGVSCRRIADDVVQLTRGGAFTATLDLSSGELAYEGLVDVDGDLPCPIFESCLRAVAAAILLRRGGALLHAASVAEHGQGFVFCGLSGAGKTTLVAGTVDGEYLSDDQSIVSAGGNQLLVWGSPFSGLAARRARPVAHPLSALVLLSSERPEATKLVQRTDRAQAAAELLRHLCCFESDADEATRAIAFVSRVVHDVPVFSLARHIDTSLSAVLHEIEATSQTRRAA